MANAPITLTTSGKFNKTTAFLQKLKQNHIMSILNRYGTLGVTALAAATPVDSGLAANSWYYTTGQQNGSYWIDFHNSDIEGGAPVVILINYGHGTRNGGYVQPHPFINAAIEPIFEAIKADVWKEVSKV